MPNPNQHIKLDWVKFVKLVCWMYASMLIIFIFNITIKNVINLFLRI